MSKRIVTGIVKEGHQVASGHACDERFPNGTLAMQIPAFAKVGVDLSPFHRGTLNVSIAPHSFKVAKAWKTLPNIKWSPVMPAENFSFYRCGIRAIGNTAFIGGLVYWPHPSTKPEFHQDSSILEILAPYLDGVKYGSRVELELNSEGIAVIG